MNDAIAYILLAVYIICSTAFSNSFWDTNHFYSKRKKYIHLILIWAVPFLWILFLKTFAKPTPGSFRYSMKRKEKPYLDENAFHESGQAF
jgi:hypothetical protein